MIEIVAGAVFLAGMVLWAVVLGVLVECLFKANAGLRARIERLEQSVLADVELPEGD